MKWFDKISEDKMNICNTTLEAEKQGTSVLKGVCSPSVQYAFANQISSLGSQQNGGR